MKELKKLALILRALGITAKVESEPIYFGSELISDNIFCFCKKVMCALMFGTKKQMNLNCILPIKILWYMILYIWIVYYKLLAK